MSEIKREGFLYLCCRSNKQQRGIRDEILMEEDGSYKEIVLGKNTSRDGTMLNNS